MQPSNHEALLESYKSKLLRTLDQPYGAAVESTYPYIDNGTLISVDMYPKGTVYVYVVPWARGWSVFADTRLPYLKPSWDTVDQKLVGLRRPVYCPRGTSGAWNVPQIVLIKAIKDIVDALHAQNTAKRWVYLKDHWPRALYWYYIKDRSRHASSHDLPWTNK